ncbi:MAG: hypothetical protein P8X74_14890 [Reinekea sp.]
MANTLERPNENYNHVIANESATHITATFTDSKGQVLQLDVYMEEMFKNAESYSRDSGSRADGSAPSYGKGGNLKLPEPLQSFLEEYLALQNGSRSGASQGIPDPYSHANSLAPLVPEGRSSGYPAPGDSYSDSPAPEDNSFPYSALGERFSKYPPVERYEAPEPNPRDEEHAYGNRLRCPEASSEDSDASDTKWLTYPKSLTRDAVPKQPAAPSNSDEDQYTAPYQPAPRSSDEGQYAPYPYAPKDSNDMDALRKQARDILKKRCPEAEEKPFTIAKENMDPFTLILLLQEERVGLLDDQVRDQTKRMQDINKDIKGLGKVIGEVNQASSGLEKGDDKTNISDELRQTLVSAGVDVPDGEISKDQLNAMSETLKSKRDGLNNDSQMEMIRLQGLLNKQQQAYQLMSTIMKKEHDLISSTIRNINS